MNWSLPVSFLIHAAILLAAIIVLPNPKQLEVAQPAPITVNIDEFGDVSQRAAASREAEQAPTETPKAAKQEPKIEKVEPKPAREVKQAAREPQAQPEAKPEPKPEPKAAEPQPPDSKPLEELIKKSEDVTDKPEPKPEQKKAERPAPPKPQAKPTPPKKQEPKKQPEFNPDQLAALLNKIDDDRAAPQSSTETGAPLRADQNMSGQDARITATALDWLRQRVGLCWNVPAGVRDAGRLIVTLRFQMDIDGNIVGQPVVENNTGDALFQAAARSAVAAIMSCQPYDMMPKETHHLWNDVRMNFDPSQMIGLN